MVVMSTADAHEGHELIVAEDGSIRAEDLARLGLAPGAHLRVLPAAPAAAVVEEFCGSLTGRFPEPSWEDFQMASALAREDFGL